MDAKQIIDQLKWRYAVKKFDETRKVSDADLKTLLDSIVLTPTSFGLQPFKTIVISNDELRAQLQPHAWNQAQVTTSSHLIVFAAKKEVNVDDVDEYIKHIMAVRGTEYNDDMKNYQGMMNGFVGRAASEGWMGLWTTKQTYIALGFLMETAALLGIDTCPMEGFVPAEFDSILGLDKEGYTATVLCPVGYRAEDDWLANLAKVRFSDEKLIEYKK